MPEFYSKRHRYGNKTYCGVLSKEELEASVKKGIIEEIHIIYETHDIVYFTDDRLSSFVLLPKYVDQEIVVPITQSFPIWVGKEPHKISTIDEYVEFIKCDNITLVWSYEELMSEINKSCCTCGNPEYGFDCVCDHVHKNPGDIEYSCEFCGIYSASKPRCNKCEPD